jgi:hypothetical protein
VTSPDFVKFALQHSAMPAGALAVVVALPAALPQRLAAEVLALR